MKKHYFLLLFLFISGILLSQNAQMNHLKEYLEVEPEAYLKINVQDKQEILTHLHLLDVDQFDEEGLWIYVNNHNLDKFESLDLDFQILARPSQLFQPKMYHGDKNTYEWDSYPTYDTYIALMEEFAANYPEICEVFSIGNSEEGRELKFVKISDNVSVDEPEAQFLYTGTMHGDETTGFVMFLRLIDYLTSNYGTDAEVTDLVNNLEIWINPAANPDGTYAGGNNTVYGATRVNANGVNLNRNYADPEDGPHPDFEVYQPETLAFMAMAEANNFVMSANTHGGAEVVNYPWDTWFSTTADDAWWRFVSHEFADTCQANSPSSYMNGFNDGITHGAEWYSISGGRQDYMNYFHHCREVTLEISDTKLIPESQLNNHWDYTHRSFINYMKQSYYGISGIITDSCTGEAIVAKVEVVDHEMDESHVYSREGQGNYHRLLKQGIYDVTFSAEGYLPKTIYDVQVIDYESTLLDVELACTGLSANFIADATEVNIGTEVQFTESCLGDPDSYEWTFEGGTPSSSNEANPIVTYDSEGSFDVSLVVTKDAEVETLTKEEYIKVSQQYLIEDGEVITCKGIFLDAGGVDGDYSNNSDYTMTIKGDASMENTVLSMDFVEFNIEPNSICNNDYLKVFDGVDENAPLIGKYCGSEGPGIVMSTNADRALTFKFHSNSTIVKPGWRAIINCTIIDQVGDIIKRNSLKVFPNPVNNGLVHVQLEEEMEEIMLYNMAGQMVQSWTGEGKEQSLNLSQVETGIYLLGVRSTKGMVYSKLRVN